MSVRYNAEKLYQNFVHIYHEAVPNPNSMKFVLNFMLMDEGAIGKEYVSAASTHDSPLAEELFKYEFTDKIFIAKNFVTLTRKASYDWADIVPVVRNFIKTFLEEGEKVFLESEEKIEQNQDSEIVTKIKDILEEYVRPAVEGDGGAINFDSFDEASGKVTVVLQGACSGCPSSTITLKAGIENLFKKMMPEEVQEVEALG